MRNLLLALLLAFTASVMAQNYTADYLKIADFEKEGKFKSALEAANALFKKADRDGDEDDMLKVMAIRAAYTFQLEENGVEAALKLFNDELANNRNRPVIAPVLHYLIGRGYYTYGQQNQYRLRNATAVENGDRPGIGAPLEDWNLQQLKEAAEEHLLRSLELAMSKRTELSSIPVVVRGNKETFQLRPTLYDLLAENAMNSLGSPLLSVGNANPDQPVRFLVTAADFANIDISDLDAENGNTRRLKIYQDLTKYHLAEKGAALLDVDMRRVKFIQQMGTSVEDNLATWERMYGEYTGAPRRGLLKVEQARLYVRTDDKLGKNPKAKALSLLDEIKSKDPAVVNAREQLRRNITTQDLNVVNQEVTVIDGNILLRVGYHNVDRVYHRLVRKTNKDQTASYYNIDQKLINALKKRKAAAAKDFRLPANGDYNKHSTETWLPAVPSGEYILLTSDNKSFDLSKGHVSRSDLQVTNLALVAFENKDEDFYEVVDRMTGAPRPGVDVTIYRQRNRNEKWVVAQNLTTDAEGRFKKPNINRAQIKFELEDKANNDVFVSDPTYSYNNDRVDNSQIYPFTPLFTDRAIYRPGQTVHVYGITGEKDKTDMPRLLTNEKRTLTLYDANGQEVGTAEVSSDEYSRFNHSFKLPTGGLTGGFRIQTSGGSVSFKMEEYKRPKFQVELEGPDFAVAGEEAEVTGKAMLFAGPGVDGAKVNYRVFIEEVQYYWWGRGGGRGGNRELVDSGETETDGSGEFKLTFTPGKDRAEGRTRYSYVVEVDVADDTGETHPATTSVPLRNDKPVIALKPSKELLDVNETLTVEAAGTDENLTISYRVLPVNKTGTSRINRKWGFPDRPILEKEDYQNLFPGFADEKTTGIKEWPAAAPVVTGRLDIKDGKGKFNVDLRNYPVGHYRIEWNYPDGTFGEPKVIRVMNIQRGILPPGMLYHVVGLDRPVKVNKPIVIRVIAPAGIDHLTYRFGSRKGEVLETTAANNSASIRYTPTDADRGGIQFAMGFVRFGTIHAKNKNMAFGWDNKKLQVDYATFRDKLRPGVPEKWTLTVKNADGSPVHAAALASMYDASLDQIFAGNAWQFSPFPSYYGNRGMMSMFNDGSNSGYGRSNKRLQKLPSIPGNPGLDMAPFSWYGRTKNIGGHWANTAGISAVGGFDTILIVDPNTYEVTYEIRSSNEAPARSAKMVRSAAPGGAPPPPMAYSAETPQADAMMMDDDADSIAEVADAAPPVQIRTNLQETAFWFPELTSNDAGDLTISFDSPEALTSWKFRVFAHDKDLNTAISEQTIVTQKELMVLPNVPRFLREGDELELTARVNNLSEEGFIAKATVEYFDPVTNKALTLGGSAGAKNCQEEQRIEAGAGTTFCFPLAIPEGLSSDGPIGYRIIVRGGGFSDGEENVIPVLTDRTLITVSQPFYLKKKDKKTVTLPVMAGNTSPSLRHVSYTFQATTNPAWMALKALPYLMEYPYDCTEQIANRYFANQLAFVTVSSKPVLETVFRQWQNDPEALKSELERNASLKNALLTETPWVRAAQSEAQQRARIGELFDLKRLADEQVATLDKLAQRQSDDGSFPWFPGGRSNRYVTQYVVESLSRLQQLGAVTPDQEATLKAISDSAILFLDNKVQEDYQDLVKRMKKSDNWRKDYRVSSSIIHYLYARSMAGAAAPEGKVLKGAMDFYNERIAADWLDYGLYEQALIASTGAQSTTSNPALTKLIVESLRERAIRKDEFGMYWKYGRGYRWSNLPIETHCRILEAFQAAGGSQDELDEMRLWLLTNKRTNRWETTKSTAAAVFALLNTGTDWTTDKAPEPLGISWPDFAQKRNLASRARAAQETAEAATGAFSVNVAAGEITSDLASVKVRNKGNELVWGGVFWQYTELAQKVEAANNGPLTLERELFHRQPTADGIRLVPITEDTPLKAGDRVTVRLILRSDRDLDFVHLKDRRAATFEPIDQLSGYNYSNGLGYYKAPGDLATNFFFDQLPKGTYTLEYDLFTTYSGSFSNGLGRVQCMYAPEFGANSDGARIVVE